MDTNKHTTLEQHDIKPTPPKPSLGSRIKKYFWHIVIFLFIATTSGVFLADHEAKSTSGWETFTSKDAGLSFKHPKSFKVVEDKGWRITIYTSELKPENNIKILYNHKDDSTEQNSVESQFLANCQAAKVSEIDASGTRIKVYEDSTCGAQKVPESVIVYSENGMTYDVGTFGTTDRNQLYSFLSTFAFETSTQIVPPALQPSNVPNQTPSLSPQLTCKPRPACLDATPRCMLPETYDMCPKSNPSLAKPSDDVTTCTMDAKECPDGSFVGRSGPNCEFVCRGGN